MKWVKCIISSSKNVSGLTTGKIYDVIKYNKYNDDAIVIKNDYNQEGIYYMKDSTGVWFEDATAEIREEKLKELGI